MDDASSELESAVEENSSDSSSFANPLPKGIRKRPSKPNFISPFVSDWHMPMVEQHLRIKFQKLVRGADVLRKARIVLDLPERHEQYRRHLKNLINFSENIDGFRLYNSRLQSQFVNIKERIMRCDDFKENQRSLLFFIELLDDLREGVSKDDPVFEIQYTELISRFAEVCLLMPYNHPSRSTWANFLGKNGFQVSAKPDVRFFKYGLDQRKSKTSISVVEVKKESDDEVEINRKRPKLDLQSSSSDSEDIHGVRLQSSSFEDVYGVRVSREERLIGQHVGELLLNLHKNVDKNFTPTCTEYSMPGLIVDGTRVSLSMLVISKEHYSKLTDGRPLEEKDEAFVYCSTFYDILLESQRNDLIELFLYFDNMPEPFT